MNRWIAGLILLLTPVCLQSQSRYAVVINEIMADPSPSAGLPSHEWIELKNTSASPVILQNWRIGDASGQSGPMPGFILQPDSFVIVCTGSAAAAMSVYGRVITVSSFPSLDNEGDLLFLQSANGLNIHAVAYSSGWYGNDVKKEGGWSLEMTDPSNPCSGGSNWMASGASSGGTPGKKNANDAPNEDQAGPRLLNAYSTDSLTIVLVFDEPVDSLSGANVSNYRIDGGVNPLNGITVPPLFNQVQLQLSAPLIHGSIYTITAVHITDCIGNGISADNTIQTGLPSDPVAGEWIINEILFNPRSNAYDFIELYNAGNKILDAAKLYIANRNGSGAISSVKLLSALPFYIFPGDHVVVTENAENLSLHYLVKNPGRVLVISSLPSYPDEEGTVIAMNFQGIVTDEIRYNDDWHFKLLVNTEGISLERIDPNSMTQDSSNWHSAASTAGYGTPTYANSQLKRAGEIKAVLEVNPRLFSPDNDGRDDITSLQYLLEEPGFVANVVIYDITGRPVRQLVRNGTLGLRGYWNWDGLDDRGLRLPAGIYIFFTELFNLRGKRKQYKTTVVLARKLK